MTMSKKEFNEYMLIETYLTILFLCASTVAANYYVANICLFLSWGYIVNMFVALKRWDIRCS